MDEYEYRDSNAIWVAKLSDGTTASQYDHCQNSWWLLKDRLKDTNIKIEKLWLQARSNKLEILPEHASGYFFIKSMGGPIGAATKLYKIGFCLDENRIKCYSVAVPELCVQFEYFEERGKLEHSIIWNNNEKKQ